jgi:hypothetical protein
MQTAATFTADLLYLCNKQIAFFKVRPHFQFIRFEFSSLYATREINGSELQHGILAGVDVHFPSASLDVRYSTDEEVTYFGCVPVADKAGC